MSRNRFRYAVVLTFAVLYLVCGLGSPRAGHAASAQRQCFKNSCKSQKGLCAAASKEQFRAAKASCSNKRCKKAAKRAFRRNKKACSSGFRTCKTCCKSDPGQACGVPGPTDAGTGNNSVGALSAGKFVGALEGTFLPFSVEEGFVLAASFGRANAQSGGQPIGSEMVAGCTISTSAEGAEVPDASPAPPLTPLDPGSPVTVDNGVVHVALVPLPAVPGIFIPASDELELFAAGFDAGQQLAVTVPGGAGIGAFNASATVPADLVVTEPQLMQPGAAVPLSGPLALEWTNPGSTPTVTVLVVAGILPAIGTGNPGSLDALLTSAVCTFPDTGAATVPGEVMSRFPAGANFTSLTVQRSLVVQVPVPLTAGGEGSFAIVTSASFSWTSNQQVIVLSREHR